MEVLKIALQYLIKLIQWAIIIQAVMSWFPNMNNSKIYYFLEELTEPIEAPLRLFLSKVVTVVDLSPLFAIILLQMINYFIERFF